MSYARATVSNAAAGLYVSFTIHKSGGTDDSDNLYLGEHPADDFSNIRVTDDSDTPIEFVLLQVTSGISAVVAVKLDAGRDIIRVYWNGVQTSATPYKIAWLTDPHYDTGETDDKRNETLTQIANFVTHMSTYQPDLACLGGDMTGVTNTANATQISWAEAVRDAFDDVSAHAAVMRMAVAPGNHDFEYMTFAEFLAIFSGTETWMESGLMYGSWTSTDFHFISLDANYTGNTHHSETHAGTGHLDDTQESWLQTEVDNASKPMIIFCHQCLGETIADYGISSSVYMVDNRSTVRGLYEPDDKVIAVIMGHVHSHKQDIVNNIPYLVASDCGEGKFSEVLADGHWATIEIDTNIDKITFRDHGHIAGSARLIHETSVEFRSQYSDSNDRPSNMNQTYGSDYAEIGNWSTNDDTFVNIDAPDLYNNEPQRSGRSMRVKGLTNTPNFGRTTWALPAAKTGTFKIKFSINRGDISKDFLFKINDGVATSTGPYLNWQTSGQLAKVLSGGPTDIQAYSIDTWYDIELRVDVPNEQYDIFVDGTAVDTAVPFQTASLTSLDTVELVCETTTTFVDTVRIEGLATSEPALSWQSQEADVGMMIVS